SWRRSKLEAISAQPSRKLDRRPSRHLRASMTRLGHEPSSPPFPKFSLSHKLSSSTSPNIADDAVSFCSLLDTAFLDRSRATKKPILHLRCKVVLDGLSRLCFPCRFLSK